MVRTDINGRPGKYWIGKTLVRRDTATTLVLYLHRSSELLTRSFVRHTWTHKEEGDMESRIAWYLHRMKIKGPMVRIDRGTRIGKYRIGHQMISNKIAYALEQHLRCTTKDLGDGVVQHIWEKGAP